MTLIECFDDSVLENIAGCLLLPVQKLILLGDENSMRAPARRYRSFLQQRGKQVDIELCDTRKKNFRELTLLLRSLVPEQERCVIDLTGGDEMTIMAIGAMLAGLSDAQRENITVQRFDPHTGTMRNCDNGSVTTVGKPASLSVAELIALHGGIVHPDSFQPDKDCTPADLDLLWGLASEDPRTWNQTISALIEFESRADSKLQVFLPLDHLHGIGKFEEKEELVRNLLRKLSKQNLIDDRSSSRFLDYTYNSSLVRFCTQKAGNVLEVKTLLEARALREMGAPRFADCQMGVSIDWDGIIHEAQERVPETRNEIDLILTQGLNSLFISCKNGGVDEDELYKLHTVATRFGGPHVRKMLIASHLEQNREKARRALEQRAWDMDIILVTDAADLSPQEWRAIFRQAMQ